MNEYENPSVLTPLFIYNPETGRVIHAVDKHGGNGCLVAAAGAPADTYTGNHGYRVISFTAGGKVRKLLAHRVAHVLMCGTIPEGLRIDHRDGKRDNNVWSNLRLVTNQQNAHNRKASGYGRCRSGLYRARISTDGVEVFIGNFATAEAARAAYLKAKAARHPTAPIDLLMRR